MEQGQKRRVFDVLKWPTKKQASTQIEIDPQAIVEAPAVLFPKQEAEIRLMPDELMSRLSATSSKKILWMSSIRMCQPGRNFNRVKIMSLDKENKE
jgi:hypothetical protein